jgi:hypothetical protein
MENKMTEVTSFSHGGGSITESAKQEKQEESPAPAPFSQQDILMDSGERGTLRSLN